MEPRDPMDIEGFDASITCGECGAKFPVEVPSGITPREVTESGKKSVTVRLPYECPECGTAGEYWLTMGQGPMTVGQG